MDDKFEFKGEEVFNIQIELLIKILSLQKSLANVIPEFFCKTDEEKDEFIASLNEQYALHSKSILHDLYARKGERIDINEILKKK